MKNKLLIAFLIALTGILISLQFFNENISAKDKDAWEYTSLEVSTAGPSGVSQINKLGDEGWELVAIEPTRTAGTYHIYVFKRPKK